MSKDNGGPAFPMDYKAANALAYGHGGVPDDATFIAAVERLTSGGITVRDYFAAKALQGICAHQDTWGLVDSHIVEHAYKVADLMLEARK